LTTAPIQPAVDKMLLEAMLPAVQAWDGLREEQWHSDYAGAYRDQSSRDHARVVYESRALWLTELVVDGVDILRKHDITDPVSQTGLSATQLPLNARKKRSVQRIALWPTNEPDIFRMAIGRGTPRALDGCEPIWASFDGAPTDGWPADLVAIRGGQLSMPAGKVELPRV
jgi:hypothetical protein